MWSRSLPLAAAAALCLLLHIARPITAAPIPFVPARFALGRCDPSSTRVDCGYYGRHPVPSPPSPHVTCDNQASTKRSASSVAVAGPPPDLHSLTHLGASRRASRPPPVPPPRPAAATAPAPMTPACATRATQPVPPPASTTAASGPMVM
jgi:hypothetical protein